MGTTDYSNDTLWLLNTADAASTIPNLDSQAKSIAVGGTVARNDLRNPADAFLRNVTLTASAALALRAEERAAIAAHISGQVANDPAQSHGGLALHATIATNRIQGGASTDIRDSSINVGSLSLTSQLLATADATIASATTSGDDGLAVGLVLPVNSLGFDATNILFSTIDALIGDSLFVTGAGVNAAATVGASTVTSGSIRVEALAHSTLTSTISNQTTTGAEGLSLGSVIALNKLKSAAIADLAGPTVSTPGSISLTATDSGSLTSSISLANSAGGSGTGVAAAIAVNDLRGGADASIHDLTLSIIASESASLTASTSSELTADSTATGKSGPSSGLGISAIIATNVLQSDADAELRDNSITGPLGAITVRASNTATLAAGVINAASASGNSIGITLAFNSIGYAAQNVLFNTIDTLIGDGDGRFGAGTDADATAKIFGNSAFAAGAITLEAVADSALSSSISNKAAGGAEGLSLGAVISLNKTKSQAIADLTGPPITAASLSMSAIDGGRDNLFSSITLTGSGGTGIAAGVSLNDVRGGAHASLHDTTLSATGNVSLTATETAKLSATISSTLAADATGKDAGGDSLAVSGIIATNSVQSAASADRRRPGLHRRRKHQRHRNGPCQRSGRRRQPELRDHRAL